MSLTLIANRKRSLAALILALAMTGCGGGNSGDTRLLSPNSDPTASAGSAQTVAEQTTVILSGSGADTDGSIVSYAWAQTAGVGVTLADADQASAHFIAPTLSSSEGLTFTLTVTDNRGATATDAVVVIVTPRFSISGTVQAASGSVIDTDVNDPSAPFTSNNTPAEAQPIPNPAVVGGFASAAGSGAGGSRFELIGDTLDTYEVFLAEGQTVTLSIADYNPLLPAEIDLDLWLYPATDPSVPIADALSTAESESVQAPYSGNFHVLVEAFSGASNYILTVGQSPLSGSNNRHTLSSADNFIAGELIIRMQDTPPGSEKRSLATARSKQQQDRFAALGLTIKAGVVERPLLLGLGNSDQRQATFAALSRQQPGAQPRPWGYGAKRDKIETIRLLKSLQTQPDVRAAGLNYIRTAQTIPNDPYYPLQWHYPLLNLPQAWEISTGNDVVIAVIDTGVYRAHPDLSANLTNSGYDFISSTSRSNDGDGIDSDPDDPGDAMLAGQSSFHGTHVAGTLAASSNNGAGVAGVAWDAQLMPIRVLGQGGGTSFDILQGIRYAAGLSNDSETFPSAAAQVINLSLGGPGFNQVMQNTIDDARDAGSIIIAAAGNDGSSTASYPAAYAGVVSVSAVRYDKTLAGYSNVGTTIDLAAPGGDATIDQNADGNPDGILSTLADDRSGIREPGAAFSQGTSMAAPHVAGIAALMKAVYPALTPMDFDAAISSGQISEDLGADGAKTRNNQYGYGLIDALKAVQYAATLAGGAPLPPIIGSDKTSLAFGTVLNQQTLSISNAGQGNLFITSVTADRIWLSVAADAVDSNNLGTYAVTVNRTGLSAGQYRGNIEVSADTGTVSLPVTLDVSGTVTTSADVGFQWLLLIDALSFETVDLVGVDVLKGRYSYSLSVATPGDYYLLSGSDSDNDLFICDAGESCGGFPLANQLQPITLTDDLTEVDFSSSFGVGFSIQTTTGLMPLGTRRINPTKQVAH
ncbi:MAG: S8 family serine peptidase [Motiliproteus sp.]